MTETLPLVSIIVPVFNGERHIGQCLTSLVGQRYPNKEIIVVDDGSTDNSAAIVRSFGDRVQYLLQDNAGSAVARNTGLDHAHGDYIAFNDGDDLWAPNRLHQQVHFMETHPEYGVATGRFAHVDESFSFSDAQAVNEEVQPSVVSSRSGWVYHTLFETSWYHIIAALVRKEVLQQVRFNPSYRRGQDYDFWLQLAATTRIAQLDTLYAYYRKNNLSISHRPHLRNYRAEIMENAVKTMGTRSQSGESIQPTELDRFFFKVWFEHGYELFLAKWYKPALQSFIKAMKYKPMRFDSYKFVMRCLIHLPSDESPR
ncbi:glycosyltransferase [Aestuariicella hydrocarbonica]|uniref:Glycosyltransferase n=1 Tax=Pseudomaricurvus hydrocarbonicus TaxID=1470433 RepID=A0A9E5JQA3_9GAMM|nr:glycosyltransferase [Aestuariicella hydrocarbonica]